MREQIRLWFYSQLFMSVALTGRAPYRKVLGYEKMLDEHGQEMHGSQGNMIARRGRLRPDGRRRHAVAVLHAAAAARTCCSDSARAQRSSASC
jgi:isoleucyl-tRNA synthetase